MTTNSTLTGPKGFRVAVVKAGIKASGKLDLGLIVADGPCTAAAVFTTNKIVSPSVTISQAHVANGKAQAVFVNAGNANACTGPQGVRDAKSICARLADHLEIASQNILITSTGIIGEKLPMGKINAGLDQAVDRLATSAKVGGDLAKAIMTTDIRAKAAYREIKLGGKVVRVAGIVKGAGMIEPNMATMLAFLTTDADITASLLKRALKAAADMTFNKVSVDKHQSTNDTALVLASGLAGNLRINRVDAKFQKFAKAVLDVCDDLAQQMAIDAEGATCAITVKVNGAATKGEARQAVRAIVDSPLVRCAFHGADPNWGRIVSAVGFSGATFKEEKLSCKIAGVFVYKNGKPVKFNAGSLSKKMKTKRWAVEVNLGAGKQEDFCYTCDLSKEYITINADYHT